MTRAEIPSRTHTDVWPPSAPARAGSLSMKAVTLSRQAKADWVVDKVMVAVGVSRIVEGGYVRRRGTFACPVLYGSRDD